MTEFNKTVMFFFFNLQTTCCPAEVDDVRDRCGVHAVQSDPPVPPQRHHLTDPGAYGRHQAPFPPVQVHRQSPQ